MICSFPHGVCVISHTPCKVEFAQGVDNRRVGIMARYLLIVR